MSLQAFKDTINKFKRIRSEGTNLVSQSLDANLDLFGDMQRERIAKGKNAEGDKLEYNKRRTSALNSTGAYTRQYSKFKSSRGGQTSHVDLNLSGKYTNQIKAKRIGATKIQVESSDSKAEKIEGNYDEVIGFTPAQRILIRRMMKDQITKSVTRILS
jgi:hypothetical protein